MIRDFLISFVPPRMYFTSSAILIAARTPKNRAITAICGNISLLVKQKPKAPAAQKQKNRRSITVSTVK